MPVFSTQGSRSRSRSRARSRSRRMPATSTAISVYKPQLARRIRFGRTDSGYFQITRRAKTIQFANNQAGNMQLYDQTTSCMTLGTPVSEAPASNTFAYPFSMQFQLNQLINSSDLTSIADYYRIKNVTVIVSCNGTQTSMSSVASAPIMWWDEDYDDAVPPTPSEIRERMGTKTFQLGQAKQYKLNVQPKVSPLVYNSQAGNAFSVPSRATWINSASPAVPHYGIKGYLGGVYAPAQPGQLTFTFDVVFDIECKDLQ